MNDDLEMLLGCADRMSVQSICIPAVVIGSSKYIPDTISELDNRALLGAAAVKLQVESLELRLMRASKLCCPGKQFNKLFAGLGE